MRGRTACASLALLATVGLSGCSTTTDSLAYATIATGYTAKQLCSCMFVAKRSRESCLAEFPVEARQQLTVTIGASEVTASTLFGAISSRAAATPEGGCTTTS